ncbi:AMP-binding protein [Streptomyces sp. SP17BM10]|uniref:acyltransferase domain-containing protein n=1 Tax=Streptomyces sp. SP17BM10 TaxID=3002530 RepID=UPI002E774786|nr:acyltransferase domain-containing protein [Streptomyces sp. SP17BM10]MEE1786190.1 AMP-binding protein [Streptomyces sp. SP17BM10]
MHLEITPIDALRRAAARPLAGPALHYEESAIGYPELLDRAGRLAEVLAAGGVTAGRQVAYLGLNSPTLLTAYLACGWLGAVFVPVDHRLGAAETGEVLRDCEVHTVVAEPGHAALVGPVPGIRLLLVDDDPAAPVTDAPGPHWTPLAAALAAAPQPPREPAPLDADDLAVLLHTPGTTGPPKAVRLTHGNLWWSGANVDAAMVTREEDVNLVVTPLSHVGGLAGFTLRGLGHGGTTVVRRGFDPERTLRDLVELGVNTFFATPSVFAALARLPGFAAADLSALRGAVVAGAPVPARLVRDYAARGVMLQQAWALTETACFAAYLPPELAVAKAGSAGRPMPFTRLRIVDPDSGADVSGPDEPGEVWVSGKHLSPGYWRGEEALRDGDGWFRTGDLGRLDADGCLYLVDRLAHAVVRDGGTVHPAEVERALAGCPGLRELAVVGAPHDEGGEAVAAVAVAEPGSAPTLDALREFGAARLAPHALPVRLHLVDAIPRNSAGTADPAALRRLLADAPPPLLRPAGVSSGSGGTNARSRAAGELNGFAPLVVSARTPGALASQARRLADALDGGLRPQDAALSALDGRAPFEHRAVVAAACPDAVRTALRALATGDQAPGLVTGAAPADRPDGGVVFVFPGQGSQWAGMGRELWHDEPVFAERMAQCGRALAPHVGWSLVDVVHGVGGAPPVQRADVAQPVTFAVMVSLAALWEAYGVRPAAVLGHSQGEIAAACVAGALSLEDAARTVALRSRAIADRLVGRGGMVSVPLPEGRVRDWIRACGDGVEVSAVNGPERTVVGGESAALGAFHAELVGRGIDVRMVPVDYASHTAQVAGVERDLFELIGDVRASAPTVPWFSTVDGAWVTGPVDAGYWYRNLREPVLLDPAVRALAGQGFTDFVEVSAHPVMTTAIGATLADAGVAAGVPVVCGTLARGEGGRERFARSLAEAFVRGAPVDWTPMLPGIRSAEPGDRAEAVLGSGDGPQP